MIIQPLSRRGLLGVGTIGIAGVALSGCATDCTTGCGTVPPPAVTTKAAIKKTSIVEMPITTSLAFSQTVSPDNGEISLIFDAFRLALRAGESQATAFHGLFRFVLPKGKARGVKAFVRGAAQMTQPSQATLHTAIGRFADDCVFPAKRPNDDPEFLLEIGGKFKEAVQTGDIPVFVALSGSAGADALVSVDSIDIALDVV
jgi:hypothetical protein